MTNTQHKIEDLSLKQKIAQMFIMGFSGAEINSENENIKTAVKEGIGGIIFFAENIRSNNQFKKLIQDLNSFSQIPLFMSIDQEGGLVERTIFKEERINFLTPMALANTKNINDINLHTEIMAKELDYLGLNMDFAPDLDINTNKNNPVIGIRSFGDNADAVIKYSAPVYKTLIQNNIMPVGKHFPGHGEAWVDSHLDMPQIDLSMDELEKVHMKPFKKAVESGLDALMIAHVHYKAFNKEKIPASLSKEIITDYLKTKLKFKGLIISDDMVMGGITNHYSRLEACIKGINAGIDVFIFRDSSDENLKLLENIKTAVKNGVISEERINESVEKILNHKLKYGLFNDQQLKKEPDYHLNQQKIDNIALKAVKFIKKGNLLPLNKFKKILVLSPDKSGIFNYSNDKSKLSDFLNLPSCEEVIYPLNPQISLINELKNKISHADIIIFISYNGIFNRSQFELYKEINKPHIAIATGVPYDTEKFTKADTILESFCYKSPAIKALAKVLIANK